MFVMFIKFVLKIFETHLIYDVRVIRSRCGTSKLMWKVKSLVWRVCCGCFKTTKRHLL